MKILHALVGYLAITALPFQVLAFPSELAAIDYDGYVNTTQNHTDGALMKQALGTIVETCQTITSQNHKGSPLIKRVPGDIIESRQLLEAAPIVALVLLDVAAVVLSVLWIEDDAKVRGNDVELHSTMTNIFLPETQELYCKFYKHDDIAVSKIQLGYLPLPLFCRV